MNPASARVLEAERLDPETLTVSPLDRGPMTPTASPTRCYPAASNATLRHVLQALAGGLHDASGATLGVWLSSVTRPTHTAIVSLAGCYFAADRRTCADRVNALRQHPLFHDCSTIGTGPHSGAVMLRFSGPASNIIFIIHPGEDVIEIQGCGHFSGFRVFSMRGSQWTVSFDMAKVPGFWARGLTHRFSRTRDAINGTVG